MFDSITSARPRIQSGKLHSLGATTARRSSALRDVPTMAEAGVPGYEVSPWFAVFAPAGTPANVVAKLNKVLNDAMWQPETLKKLEGGGGRTHRQHTAGIGNVSAQGNGSLGSAHQGAGHPHGLKPSFT